MRALDGSGLFSPGSGLWIMWGCGHWSADRMYVSLRNEKRGSLQVPNRAVQSMDPCTGFLIWLVVKIIVLFWVP